MNLSAQASTAARWTAASSVITTVLGVVQIAVLARLLSPEDFGAFAFLGVVMAFCEIFVRVGFSDVIVVDKQLQRSQLSTLYWMNILIGLVMYAVLYFAAALLPYVFDYEGIVSMARVLGLSLILGSSCLQFHALMRKEIRFAPLSMLAISQALLATALAIILAMNGFGVWSLLYSALVAQAYRVVVLFYFAVRQAWLPGAGFEFSGVTEQLRFGAFRIGAALINTLNSRVDQLAVGAILGPAALGYYNMAFGIAIKPFSKINPILTQITMPIFSKISSDKAAMLRGYRKGLRLLMFVNAPLLLGYVAVAPQLVEILIGPGWEPVVGISQILAFYVLFRSASNLNIGLIVANGKYRWPLYWNAVILVFVPLAILVVTSVSRSPIAVSAAMLLVYFVLFVVAYFVFLRRLLGPFGKEFASDFFRPVAVAALMSVCVFLFAESFSVSYVYLQAGLAIGLGVVIYATLSLIFQKRNLQEFRRM